MGDILKQLVELHPAWRQAIKDFVSAEFKPGHVLDYDWLYAHFKIPQPSGSSSLNDAEQAQLRFLSAFKNFEETLLTDHQTALQNVRGIGYRIVPPKDQTEWAEKDGFSEIRKAYRKLGDRLSNVAIDQLSAEDRKKNADALARYAMLKAMVKRVAKADKTTLDALESDAA